jgi:drug efflux transport system ATP-binding protein
MVMADIALSLEDVVKRYGSVTALNGVSFDVRQGEMFGLIGPDGAGKTTTIRLLCGLVHADGGTVRVLGKDPVANHAAVTRSVGYLSQRFSLYGDLSIDENIAFFAEIHGLWRYEDRRRRLLELTQLLPFRNRLADRLSGGMKQKLALACTLIHEPRVILLDEPTTGVDPVSRREFWKLLAEFLQQGITILVSTPYLDEAERCHRVALLHDGKRLALDTPDALRRSLPGRMLEVMVADQARAIPVIQSVASVVDVRAFGERVHVRLSQDAGPDAATRVTQALEGAGFRVTSARTVQASLEDVFIVRLEEVATQGR